MWKGSKAEATLRYQIEMALLMGMKLSWQEEMEYVQIWMVLNDFN
jgi:hypothetical protein